MNQPLIEQSSNSRPPSRLWILPGLLSAALPACLTLMAGGLVCALAWRSAGTAPLATVLCDGLGAALWLAALWLAPALDGWQLGWLPAPDAARRLQRQATAVLAGLAAGLPLAAAPLGVLLAYDPTVVLASIRPLDTAQLEVTLPALLWRLLVYVGPACVALSLGLLLLARRLLGFRIGSLLWLGVGLLLHAPLFAGPKLVDWPLTLGNWARLSLGQLSNPDLLQQDQVFDPLHFWLIKVWVLAAAILALATFLRPARPIKLPALAIGVTSGLLACTLRSVELGQRWAGDAARLLPDSAPGLVASWLCVTALVWAVLAAQSRQAEPRELAANAWLALPAAGGLVLCSLPLWLARAATWPELLASFAIAVLVLWLCLTASLAWSVVGTTRGSRQPRSTGILGVLTTLVILLIACTTPAAWPSSESMAGGLAVNSQPQSTLAELVAAALQPELLPAALTVLACSVLAGLACFLLARPKPWRAQRQRLPA